MNERIRSITRRCSRAGWVLPAVLLWAPGANRAYSLSGRPEAGSSLIRSSEAVIFSKVNEERTKHGLPELTWASDVAEVAREHSKDMAVKGYFAHMNQEGNMVDTRLENAGIVFSVSAENLFTSNDFTEIGNESVRRWMNSPHHRDNLLNAEVAETGVGIYKAVKDNNYYVTQVFIKRALKIIPSPSRLSGQEIDTIFEIIKTVINKSKYEFNYSAVRKRILKELTNAGIPVKEDIYVEGCLKDIPVLGMTMDIIASNGFIVNFTEDDPDDELGIYERLVHAQGYSAAVLIHEADGEVRFPIIKMPLSEPKEYRDR